MLDPKPEDFARLRTWPMIEDPLAAIKQFHPTQLWLRWFKPAHLYMYYAYWRKRKMMARSDVDMREYYKQARMPHEKHRWDYLKLRKSWFIVPLHWERFAAPDCARVLDAGCGDGDMTQRVVETIEAEWGKNGQVHPIEIVGVDLNQSRVENAKNLCSASYKEITLNFMQGDFMEKFDFPDRYFDYALCTGVLEILADDAASTFVKNLCRVVKKAIYIEDLADRFPGGYPRDNLDFLFRPNNFRVAERHWLLTEPFSMFSIPDPCYKEMKWPMQRDQVLWVERIA